MPFKDFIKWIASGNQAADEHWTPAVQLCVACRAGYDFIGHAEHFNEDIEVVAKMLKIDSSVIPDTYRQINQHASTYHSDDHFKNKTTEEMFADVPESSLRSIRLIYSADYETFSYVMPEWLANV